MELNLRGPYIECIRLLPLSVAVALLPQFLGRVFQRLRLGLALSIVLVDVVPQHVTKFVPRLVCRPVELAGEDSRVPTKVNLVNPFSRRRQRLPPLQSGRIASAE